jgi:hypothetical protein
MNTTTDRHAVKPYMRPGTPIELRITVNVAERFTRDEVRDLARCLAQYVTRDDCDLAAAYGPDAYAAGHVDTYLDYVHCLASVDGEKVDCIAMAWPADSDGSA